MLNEQRVYELSENFNKEIRNLKMAIENRGKNLLEMKNTLTEIKNILWGNNNWVDKAEDQVSDLEDKVAENTHTKQQKEKKNLKNEHSLIDLWDNIK